MNTLQDLQKSLDSITSKEIAKLTGKRHDNVLRDIVKLNKSYEKMSLLRIQSSEYTTTRGIKYPMFTLATEQLGNYIDERSKTEDLKPLIEYYNKMESSSVRSILLASKKESAFGEMLRAMFNDAQIQTQVPFLGKYRADFIIDGDILVEYDEAHHEHQLEADVARQEEILDAMDEEIFTRNEEEFAVNGERLELRENPFLAGLLGELSGLRSRGRYCKCVRVKEGFEIEGLREIVVLMASNHTLIHNISGIAS